MNDAQKFLNSNSPIEIFADWLANTKADTRIKEPTAMTLSTYEPNTGDIHSRVVLLKEFSEQGFTFFTNYDSQKGMDLAAHNKATLHFYWDPQFKQIKIQGIVTKTSRSVSESYWNSRARDSQLSQWISAQSKPVSIREDLEKKVLEAKKQFDGKDIPCPEHWGGYLLTPTSYEFWIGQPNRLHDRFLFKKLDKTWTIERLYP